MKYFKLKESNKEFLEVGDKLLMIQKNKPDKILIIKKVNKMFAYTDNDNLEYKFSLKLFMGKFANKIGSSKNPLAPIYKLYEE